MCLRWFLMTLPRRAHHLAAKAVLVLATFLAGCSSDYWQRSADREAARLIREKTPLVPNMETNFSVEPRLPIALESLSLATDPKDYLGTEGETEREARVLPLDLCLGLAVRQSRDFQTRREVLYLNALDLSLARRRLRPIFGARGVAGIRNDSPERVIGTDPITQQQTTALKNGNRVVSGFGNFGISWLLATGARLTTDFTTDFFRYLAGGSGQNTSSRLAATLSQPLLRGAGFGATMEALTQSERGLLYALREFAQYRQTFAVDTAAAYYAVLQARDTARNSFLDLSRSRQNVARERAFADEGQRPRASLDQFRQAELNSETRWSESVRGYREALDRFKISLGIPVTAKVVLDDRELAKLSIAEPGVPMDQAIPVALATRLDLHTAREQAEDALRKVPIAKRNLLPQVDAVAAGGFSNTGNRGIPSPDPNLYQWNVGLQVDLGLDRKAQRNDLRRALIVAARSKREFALAVDNVRLQIASDGRALDQARRNFENSELGVSLGERRVEEQELRMQLGRGVTRDLLDAQSDLNNARNARTAALVSYTLARLRYWRDMGLLFVRDDGLWYEAPVPESPPNSPIVIEP
jgi:outer membrane protein TolC